MFCASCGKKIDLLSKYCSGCGKKTAKSKILPYAEALFEKPGRIRSLYKEHIKPHHEKIAKLLPPVAGSIIAVALIFTIVIPAYGQRMFEVGREHISESRHAEAEVALRRASAAGINGPEINMLKGYALMNLGELERAREYLLADEENITPAKLRVLADVWHQEGDGHMYANTLRELIRLTPNDPHAYLRLAAFYKESGLFENAAVTLESLLARQRNSAAKAELYNTYMKSFAVNTSLQRARTIRPEAMDAFNAAHIESLDVGGGQALSLSPSGRYVVVYVMHSGQRYLDVYELLELEFRLTATFRIPLNYVIDSGMIAWSPDETMLAFFNSAAEKFVSDSSIHLCNIPQNQAFNLTDPGADFTRYLSHEGVFIIDSLPTFSQDSQTIYFARQTPQGNWLASIDISGDNLTYLFEPPGGGFVEYKIIERGGRVFFSVAGPGNNPLWGIYMYEDGAAQRLNFYYDNRLYYLALKDITPDGQFMLYYLTVASQNNSMLLGVVNLETMEPVRAYQQEMDSINGQVVAINRSNIFGQDHTFVTRNAIFGNDGRSLIVAEDAGDPYGKVIRRFALSGNIGSYIYISFDTQGTNDFSVPQMNKSGTQFRQIGAREFLIYDNGLKILSMEAF